MKKILLLGGLLLGLTNRMWAQIAIVSPDSTLPVKYWQSGATGTFNFNQVGLSNWSTGGTSSVSALSLISLYANYKRGDNSWTNTGNFMYGLVKPDQGRLRKSEDQIDVTSKYGRNVSKYWYYAAQVNFRSQFTKTLIPETQQLKSRFLAPAFMLGSLGFDYKPKDNFSLFLSPVTGKFTLVRDQQLADAGAFGVSPAKRDTAGLIIPGTGETLRQEVGAYLNARFQKPLMENIVLQTQLDLFSNFNHNPQNIDANWQTSITMKVNKLISVSIFTHLIYDDDINIKVDDNKDGIMEIKGPRIQFKETLGLGISYKMPTESK